MDNSISCRGWSPTGTTRSLSWNIENHAEFEFAQDFDADYLGTVSGSGGLLKSGGGVVTLTEAQRYTGATHIQAGGLALANNGSLDAASVVQVAAGAELDLSRLEIGPFENSVLNDGLLIGGSVDATSLAGTISGGGDFEGMVNFTGYYAPGNSPALVTHDITTFSATNVLEMELGGLRRGAEYDAIDADVLNLAGPWR